MKPLVSVVMPIYNGREYVEPMLESIVRQTYRPLQLILYDDASIDDSLKVLNKWRKKQTDKDVYIEVYKSKKNRGIRISTSKAVLYARGKYIFFADQDDIWISEKIEVQVKYMEQNYDCMACFCRRKIMSADGRILLPYENIKNPVFNKKMTIAEVIARPACFPANCLCLRNRHLDKIFPIHNMYSEHDSFITIMAAHFGNIVILRDTLVKYRIHKGNLSNAYFAESNWNLLFVFRIEVAQLKKAKITYRRDEDILKTVLYERFKEDYTKISNNYHREPVKHVYLFALYWLLKKIMIGDLNRFNRNQ